MSVVSCNLDRDTTDLATVKVGVDGFGGFYKLRYNVMTGTVSGPLTLLSQALSSSPHPLPALWQTYSYQGDTDPRSYAKSYNVERDPKTNLRYFVTVNFEPAEPGEIPDGGGSPIMSEPDPLARATLFWWDREVFTDVAAIDVSSRPVVNYANNLYEELTEHERTQGVLVAEWNVPDIAAVVALERQYARGVNQSEWLFKGATIPPRAALCRQVIAGALKVEGSGATTYRYYPVQMRIAFADLGKTWDTPKPEMGRSYFTKTSGIFDLVSGFRRRVDAGTVVPLNTDGTRRTDTDPILVTNWRIRREVNFNALRFSGTTGV